MAEKASFDKVSVRPITKRKIEVLRIFHGKTVDYIAALIDAEWEKALAEEKVNDLMLAEPVGKQAPMELPS